MQIVISVLDGKGQRVSNSPPVLLAIEAGPGELPTGRSIAFAPDSDIMIRDGEAAIAMRSWQAGTTRLRATSPGLKDAVAEVRTIAGPPFKPGKTPLAADRQYVPFGATTCDGSRDGVFGLNNPTDASSSAAGHSARLVNDGDVNSYWAPGAGDPSMSITIDTERLVDISSLVLSFPRSAPYGFVATALDQSGKWQLIAEQQTGLDSDVTRSVSTRHVVARYVRVSLRVPAGALAGLAELRVMGALRCD